MKHKPLFDSRKYVAVNAQGEAFNIYDAKGDFRGFATWAQLRDSLAAGPEGWIEGDHGVDIYVDGNEDEMRDALATYDAA